MKSQRWKDEEKKIMGNYHTQSRIVNRTVNAINVKFCWHLFDRGFIYLLNEHEAEEKEIQKICKHILLVSILSTKFICCNIGKCLSISPCEFMWNRHEFGMKIQDESNDAVWLHDERDFSFLWILYSQMLEPKLASTDFSAHLFA